MSELRVLLLGPPVVYFDEEPIAIQRRALRSLLFYLAHHENMIDRAQLILALWPEVDETKGRRRMRETLSKLRAALPDPELIVTDQDRVGLDRGRLYIDALEFEDLFWQCNRFINSTPRDVPLPEQVQKRMNQAVALWRAPRFMSGFNLPASEEFDSWLLETQNRYERKRIRLIERLADHDAAAGDLESAISRIQRILDEYPDNPDWQYRYLNWLHQAGMRSEALGYCNYLSRLYRDKVGFASDRLRDLWDEIRQQSSLPEIIEIPNWPPPSLIQYGFVGRQHELDQVRTAYQRGGMVSILGEYGSGKTRLFYEFSRQYAHGARLLVFQARQSSQNIPYQPFVEMLRQSIQPEEWAAMDPAWFAPLVLMMPELSRYLPQVSHIHDTYMEGPSGMLFESLHQVLKALTQKSRLMLFLDDAQWCDRTSLDVFGYLLGQGFFDKHTSLVIASRMEDSNPALEEFLSASKQADKRYIEIHLGELSLKEASELLNTVLGRTYPLDVVASLMGSISGYPLHLLEVLRTVFEYSSTMDLPDTIDQLPLPKSIQELVRRRMSNLSTSALQVLQIAAVTGERFSPALLERSADLDAEQVVRALEDLERMHLAEAMDSAAPGVIYHFPYERIRHAVLIELSEARKRMLHLNIARAMQTLPEESQKTSLIAHHFEEAGELKAAFDYWVKTGERTSGMYSRSETLQAFRRAEALMQSLADFVTDEEVYQLYSLWGRFLDITWDLEEAIKLGFSLQRWGIQRKSPLLLGLAFNNLSRAYRRKDDYEKSLEYSEKAMLQLERANHRKELTFGFIRNSLILNLVGKYEGADRSLQKAISLSTGSNDQMLQTGLASAIIQMTAECNYKGLPLRTQMLADLARRSIYSTFVIPDMEMIEIARANAYFLLGRYRESYDLCKQVRQRALEQKSKRLEAYADMILARASMSLGFMDECLEKMDNALQVAEQYNYPYITQFTYGVRGDFFHKFGDFKRSFEEHQKGLKITSRVYYRLDNSFRMALAMMRLGDVDHGKRLLQETMTESHERGFAYICLPARLILADEQSKAGDDIAAEENFRRIIEETEKRRLLGLYYNAKFIWARHLFSRGDVQTARRYAQEVLAFSQESGFIWLEISNQILLHQILQQTGETTQGIRQRVEMLQAQVLPLAKRPEIHDFIQKYFKTRLNGLN